MTRRAIVLHPELAKAQSRRSSIGNLQEAVGLAQAIDLDVAQALILKLHHTTPATLLGSGKVQEIGAIVETHKAGLVIINGALTPVQQRNLETAWKCKVIDRTALILEIFGARARTREGQLQVELASLNYQKSRLVRSWTHLERQRGGFGFLGGPGETQIETDRRLIRDRIGKIKRELQTVVKTRGQHRKARQNVPFPMVALVGYTNAGKSTLFNTLTHAKVFAHDQLFATLDPTIRALRLPSGFQVLLSDTVGFISDLPTTLVAAFRATLEEVLEADLLLHVRDIAHPDAEAQKQDVLGVLRELFDRKDMENSLVEVWNKMDLLKKPARAAAEGEPWENLPAAPLLSAGLQPDGQVAVSAITKEGLDALLQLIDTQMTQRFLITQEFTLAKDDGETVAWLYKHGQVLQHEETEAQVRLTVQMTSANRARYEKRG